MSATSTVRPAQDTPDSALTAIFREPFKASSDNGPYFIAEAGVNHNGSLEQALRLIDAAKEAGADCVKFQTFRATRVATPQAPKAQYQLRVTDTAESQIDMLRQLEMDDADTVRLIDHCRDVGIDYLSTPYNRQDVDLLARFPLPALKLASMHCAEPPMLAYAARTGLPLILSTGMATLAEIDRAVATILATGNGNLVLLQCTTNYPTAPADVNLRAMTTLAGAFGLPVGYSDHTVGAAACIAATALGARVLEKHFTLDRSLPGPDHAASAEPGETADLIRAVRETAIALGDGMKRPCAAERANTTGMRRSLVADRDLPAGHRLSMDDLDFRRPCTGIPVADADRVVGCRLVRPVSAGESLAWKYLEVPV